MYVEIFVSSTRVLPRPLPMAQLRCGVSDGGVFLSESVDVRIGVSINFPPLNDPASSGVTRHPWLPWLWADLEEVANSMLPPVTHVTEVLNCSTNGACTVVYGCFIDSLMALGWPRCSNSSSEHLDWIEFSDSESDILCLN